MFLVHGREVIGCALKSMFNFGRGNICAPHKSASGRIMQPISVVGKQFVRLLQSPAVDQIALRYIVLAREARTRACGEQLLTTFERPIAQDTTYRTRQYGPEDADRISDSRSTF